MKKTYLILVLCFTVSISVFAQNRTRIFDNFDTSHGVRVLTPTVTPIIAARQNKKLVKKTVQSSASVRDAFALKDMPQQAPVEYSKLVMASTVGMKGFTTGDLMYDSYIVESSRRYNIDPLLIYAQMHQESSFKIRATSNKGASGLMQLMPGTARRFGVTDIYNPKQNIEAGVKYMRWLLNTFGGDVSLALAGYNAGEGAVMRYGNSIPPFRETQEYVRRITNRYSEITNPGYVRSVKKVSTSLASRLENKVSKPLTVWEPNAVAIKLPDGRMRLVNQ